MATTRTIMPTRLASSGRYSPENSVAYQPGNAANMAPPAVISHTSLPSHTGPMVLSAARRCASAVSVGPPAARPNGAISMPTPKSNPSSRKNPRNSAATTTNHTSCKPMAINSLRGSIGERQRRDLVVARRRRRDRFGVVVLGALHHVALQQPEPDDRQYRVDQGE